MTTAKLIAAAVLPLGLLAAACASGGVERPGHAVAAGPMAAAAHPAGSAALAEGVTVSGVGRVAGRPDTLRTTVGVEVERARVQEALDAANTAAERVIAAVRDQGVAPEDIRTVDFSVHPRFAEEERGGQPEIRGYVVTNLVEVTVRDTDRAGAVLEAAVEAGGDAARVHGLSFALEDNAALLERARANAFAEARRKAEHYADLAGRRLGALVSVAETVGGPPPVERFAGDAAARASVPIEPGEQEVTVEVTAVWALR